MRILPDAPSVDYLRREAKDVLSALREDRPDATLADAQALLAEQYGHRTWADLKAEVDQRRGEPAPVAPPGLGDALAHAFGLGRVTEPPAAVAFTPQGRTWSIATERGRWLATPHYWWAGDEVVRRGEALAVAAREAGVATTPPLVETAAGGFVERFDDTPWLVHEWVQLGPVPMPPIISAAAGQLGAILGRLHGLDLPSDDPITPYLAMRRPMAQWTELTERAARAARPWAGRLADLLPTIEALTAVMVDPHDPARRLSICNLVPEAVRVGAGGTLVVTDWTFSGSLTPALELANVAYHWLLGPLRRRAALQAFATGYRSTGTAWPDLDRAAFGVAVGGWLSWTFNHACEAIDSDDPDKAAFARREVPILLADPLTVQVIDGFIDQLAAAGA